MDVGTVKITLEQHIESETRLLRGSDGQVYVQIRSKDGDVEVVPIDSKQFEEWLILHCFETWIPARRPAIKAAIAAIKASQRGVRYPIAVRVGGNPHGEVYWDLSNGSGKAVEMTANGWHVVEDPKVLFPTHGLREGLSEPQGGGSIRALGEMFGLSTHNEALIIAFCLACLKGSGPYPTLLITGPENSGKTTLATYLKALLDPSAVGLRALPSSEKELATSARDNFLLVYDHVQTVSDDLGSAVSRLNKGTTFVGCSRGVEQIVFQGARPVVMAGSDEMLVNRDLASRALVVRLETRPCFTSGRGMHLDGLASLRGALLDIVCHGLRRLDGVKLVTPQSDYEFEKWIEACELPHWGLAAFSAAYELNVAEGRQDLVELDPLLTVFEEYIRDVKSFRGTAGQLLQELNAAAGIPKGRLWPRNPRALSGRLRRDVKLLPEIEMAFGIKEGRNRDRLMFADLKHSPELPEKSGSPAKAGKERAGTTVSGKIARAETGAELPLFSGD
jgi:putative DNA primase/helicase